MQLERILLITLAAAAIGLRSSGQNGCSSAALGTWFPADGATNDGLGVSMASNASGRRIVVGSAEHAHMGVHTGAAWVISNPATTAQSEVELQPSIQATYMKFSTSLAMNAEGDLLVVGTPRPNGYQGTAYVFRFNGMSWSEEWIAFGDYGDKLGTSVAVSASGDVFAAGAPERSPGPYTSRGAVEVYRHGTGGWFHEATLVPAEIAAGGLYVFVGSTIAMSADGKILAVRSGSIYTSQQPNGTVYVFEHDGNAWVERAKLHEPVAHSTGGFGSALALDHTGEIIVAGNDEDSRLAYMQGAATIFRRSGTTWLYETALLPSIPAPNGSFGWSVSVNAAGDRILVGEVGASTAGAGACGAVSEFESTNAGWQFLARHLAPTPEFAAHFGASIGASAAGSRWVAGAFGSDAHGVNSGRALFFGSSCASPVVYCSAQPNSLGCVPQIGADGRASLSLSHGFTISAAGVRNQQHGMLFYGTNGRASMPWKGGTLCVQPPLHRLPLLNSAGSLPPMNDCTGAFAFDFNAWAATDADPTLFAGQHVRVQYVSRDPGAAFHVNSTDAVEFYLQP